MLSVYGLKPKFQDLLRPLVKKLATAGITANQVTVATVLLSFGTGALILLTYTDNRFLLAIPTALFVRMALNAIDGMLAREHNMKSSLGAILNELGDVFSDAAIYLPISMIEGISAIWVILGVLLGVISEMAGVVAVQIGTQRRYDGPMGKSDRAFVFGLIGLLLGLGVNPQPWVDYVLMVTILLLIITIVNRCRRALKDLA